MKLIPLERGLIPLAGEWLAEKSNYQWLDFGGGVQTVTPAALKIMTQKSSHLFRIFTADDDDRPLGLVALSQIAPNFGTANLWYVLGDKTSARRGYTRRAVAELLTLGFTDLKLTAVSAWAVADNVPSIYVLIRNRFKLIGRLRGCHPIDGVPRDRMLFDLLATEHEVA